MWAYVIGISFRFAMNGILLVCLIPDAKVLVTFNFYDVLLHIFAQDTNIYNHIWMHQQKSAQFMFVCPFNCTLAYIYCVCVCVCVCDIYI